MPKKFTITVRNPGVIVEISQSYESNEDRKTDLSNKKLCSGCHAFALDMDEEGNPASLQLIWPYEGIKHGKK